MEFDLSLTELAKGVASMNFPFRLPACEDKTSVSKESTKTLSYLNEKNWKQGISVSLSHNNHDISFKMKKKMQASLNL